MDIEGEDRIEDVIGKQNKNKFEKYPLSSNLFEGQNENMESADRNPSKNESVLVAGNIC